MGTGSASGAQAGIIPRALDDIFQALHDLSLASLKLDHMQPTSDYTLEKAVVRVAFLEIYNDELVDLLGASPHSGRRTPSGRAPSPGLSSGSIQIREEKGGAITWTGLREVPVLNAADALEQLWIGLGRRATNATDMNAQSSRSHAIFSVMLDQQLKSVRGTGPSVRRKSKFNFVDLAGSERVRKTKNEVGGDRFKEGIAINVSTPLIRLTATTK